MEAKFLHHKSVLMDQNFTPIPVSTLRGDIKIPFDVYVMIRGKHVHYLKKGDSFEGERLTRLKERRLKNVFILTDARTNYSSYVTQSLNAAYDASSNKDIVMRAEIIQGAQESRAESLLLNPSDQESYLLAKEGSEKYVNFLLAENHALKAMLAIQNQDGNLAHHGVSVSAIAVKIAQRLGYTEAKALTLMALGALLHDYGHVVQPMDINRPVTHMAPSERKVYQTHCKVGAEKLRALKHFDAIVVQIVLEHEECANGSGYPGGLVDGKISREAQFVGLANQFDRLLTFEKRPPVDAIRLLLADKIGSYPEGDLNALRFILSEQGVVI